MTNRTVEVDAMVFTLGAHGGQTIRTCPTSRDGATERVEDNVRKRASVDVVRGGSGAGTVLAPTRYRPGDVGGPSFSH